MSKPDFYSYYTFLDNEVVGILSDINQSIIEIYDKLSDIDFHDKYTSSTNSAGHSQTSLDLIAQDIFVNYLSKNSEVAYMISEESEDPILLNRDGRYIVALDPIDGSSNTNINSTSGTIFTIFPLVKSDNEYGFLLPHGRDHIISGFSLFGIKCLLLIAETITSSYREFVWDRQSKAFITSSVEGSSFPNQPHYYSINEGYTSEYNTETMRRIEILKSKNLSQRVEGCLISDLYRLIKKGGIYLYPERKNLPAGKLRLLYECIPVALIAECAGGAATDGKENILDINPTTSLSKKV